MLAESETSVKELLAAAAFFVDSAGALEELAGRTDDIRALRERVGRRGEYPFARTLRVNRLRAPEHNGYPLRRAQLVVFNREMGTVSARLTEVAAIIEITGIGTDEAAALSDLEGRFDRLVREKVRIPPHAREEQDEPIRVIVNHLVDWERFEQENPLPRLLCGRVLRRDAAGRLHVRWLFGPGDIHDRDAVLLRPYATPYFDALQAGEWFQGVVKEHPARVEWLDPPAACPDPTDRRNQLEAWEAIPRALADDPDAWPRKEP
jgi:hypothetical protein